MFSFEHKNYQSDRTARYDRQVHIFGDDAVRKMHDSNVLIVGLGGIGAEIGIPFHRKLIFSKMHHSVWSKFGDIAL
jgi:lactate dehydrogenase-like 2-hydroxyacid dehydrogenase